MPIASARIPRRFALLAEAREAFAGLGLLAGAGVFVDQVALLAVVDEGSRRGQGSELGGGRGAGGVHQHGFHGLIPRLPEAAGRADLVNEAQPSRVVGAKTLA